MKKVNRLTYIMAVVLAFMLCLITLCVNNGVGGKAYAISTTYTGVLNDLTKDPNFMFSAYAENATDYSINVIQIAESKDGELFVYTYQPCQNSRKLTATDINMSQSQTVNGTNLLSLTHLNSWGVFCKYKVNDLTVSSSATRYYNVTSIYREFIKDLDNGTAGGENTTNGVSYPVGQLWTVTGFNSDIKYEMKVVETLKIDSEYISSLRYGDGFQFDGTKYMDAHFYAFSTTNKIDRLMSADIVFETTAYSQLAGQQPKTQDPVKHEITLYGEERSNDGGGWFGKKYSWDTLVSTKEFISNAEAQGFEFNEDKKKEILKQDWILNFYETPYTCEAGGKDVLISAFIPFGFIWTIINGLTTTGETVSNVSLLRLEYDYNGEIYNLGVVSNKVTGDKEPVNADKKGLDFFAYVWDCVVKLFTGQAATGEKIVAVITLAVALLVFAIAIWFIKLIYRLITK